ncbi:hypothetical protein [Streptomyces sp. RPT161]|uniref:hypothetical protein n=1 Tax=Streptomyces sp. RPT161 TaxID=3015993 RepID=UPI0022B89C1E|nr:hypothetical protein [Streptomyces sp. RPT161]
MTAARAALPPWRFVVSFGVVSLLADFVYECARPVTGPLLGSLGGGDRRGHRRRGRGGARAAAGVRAAGRPHPAVLDGHHRRVPADRGERAAAGRGGHAVGGLRAGGRRAGGKAVRGPAKDTLLSHAAPPPGAAAASRRPRRWTRPAR